MRNGRFSRMSTYRKRAFAAALAVAVVSTSFNIGGLVASASSSARGRIIASFDRLPDEIAEQTLPVGGSKSDLKLPKELDVVIYSDEETEDEDSSKKSSSSSVKESSSSVRQTEQATEAVTEGSTESTGAGSGSSDGSVNSTVTTGITEGSTGSTGTESTGVGSGSSDGSVNSAVTTGGTEGSTGSTGTESTGAGSGSSDGSANSTVTTGITEGNAGSTGAGSGSSDGSANSAVTTGGTEGSAGSTDAGSGSSDGAVNDAVATDTGNTGSGEGSGDTGSTDSGLGAEEAGGPSGMNDSVLSLIYDALIPVNVYAAEPDSVTGGSGTGNSGDNTATDTGSPSGSPATNTTDTGNTSGSPATNTTDTGSPSGSPATNTTDTANTSGSPATDTTDTGSPSGSPATNTTDTGNTSGSPASNTADTGSTSENKGDDSSNGSTANTTGDVTVSNAVSDNTRETATESFETENKDEEEDKLVKLSEGEHRTLEDVRWKLDRDRSEYGSRFQAVRAGDVFFFVPDIKSYGLKTEAELPSIRVTIVAKEESVSTDSVSADSVSADSVSADSLSANAVSANTVSTNTVSGNTYPEFSQFMIVDGVKVSVTAPEGVFPEGAELNVRKIDDDGSNTRTEQALKADMGLSDGAEVNEGISSADDNKEGGASAGESLDFMTFDITIKDVSGNEIQPKTEEGKPTVTFSQADIISDYIESSGEETDGKLNENAEGADSADVVNTSDGSSGTTIETTSDGGRVYILDGEGGDQSSKKTLRVYHFDEGSESPERLSTEIDAAEASVSVEAEHFSEYTIGIGATYTAGDTFGDYKITCQGAKCRITLEPSDAVPTSENITKVTLVITPGTSPSVSPTVNIGPREAGLQTSQQLFIVDSGASGTETTVNFNDLDVSISDSTSYWSIQNFKGANLCFNNFKFYKTGSLINSIDLQAVEGKMHLNGVYIESKDPFRFSDSTIDCYLGSGENVFIKNSSGGSDINSSQITLQAEEGVADASLDIYQGENATAFYAAGNERVTIKSGKYNITGGRFMANGALQIDGGEITAESLDKERNSGTLYINGGTHRLSYKSIGRLNPDGKELLGADNSTGMLCYINGGSIKITDADPTHITDPTYSKYLHKVQLIGAADGTKITGLYAGGHVALRPSFQYSYNYGFNECMTDSDGMVYLWYNGDSSNNLYSADTEDGKHYVWDYNKKSSGETGNEPDSNVKCATVYDEYGSYSVFSPYVYITNIKPIYKNIIYGNNYYKDIIAFEASDGKTYSGTEVIGKNINGLYDRLKDIKFITVKSGETAGLTVEGYDASTNLPDAQHKYTITAEISDLTGLARGATRFTFSVPEYISVEKITSSPGTIEVEYGKSYTNSGSGNKYSVLGATFTAVPVYATAVTDNKTWSWTITPSNGTTETLTMGGTYTPNKVGAYTLKASIPEGKSETAAYEQTFTVNCKKPLTHNDISVKWTTSRPYTGSAVTTPITVKDQSTTLKEGTDYTVTYKDNTGSSTKASTASFTITGMGNYTGSVTKSFTITPNIIKDADVTLPKNVYGYTGKALTPEPVVTYNGTTLKKDTDYTLSYSNNVNESKNAVVTVTGKGKYTGTVNKTFRIKRLPTGSIVIAGKTYTGFPGKNTTDAYTRTADKATVSAKAADSGTLKSVQYYVSNTYYSTETALTKAADGKWTTYSESSRPTLLTDSNNYIYVKLTDGDGDSEYIATNNIVEDQTAPTATISKAAMSGTTATATITGSDALSGIGKYYLLIRKITEDTPANADEVIKSGAASDNGVFRIDGIAAGKYNFYAVTVDKAGNKSAIISKGPFYAANEISINIQVMGHTYDAYQGKQEIDDYTNKMQEIVINASGGSSINSVQYYIDKRFYASESELYGVAGGNTGTTTGTSVTTDSEGKQSTTVTTTTTTGGAGKWSTYRDNSRPGLVRNQLNYIYAKVEYVDDTGATKTKVVSSKGIWEDETAPKVTSAKATPKDTTADGTVKGKDGESGVAKYYLAVKKSGESAPSKAEDVKSGGLSSTDGKFKIEGLTAKTKYDLYAVVEDKAGNLSAIKKSSMTSAKAAAAANKAAAGSGKAGAASVSGESNVKKRTEGQKSASGNSASDNSALNNAGIRDGVPYIEDATEGILIGRDKTSGWDRIESEVGKAMAPAQIFVNMNGGTDVPAEAFNQIRGRDVTCYFLMNDDITWAVNGLSFTEAPKDIDFRVRLDTKNIPSKLVNEVADVYPHTNLTLEHDGSFGFTAIMSINVSRANEGMYANLYYYNEDGSSLEFVESSQIDGGGRASFEFVHASDYTVIVRGDALTDKSSEALISDEYISNAENKDIIIKNTPRDNSRWWLIIVSAVSVTLCGIILFMPEKGRRRRFYNRNGS